jgi:2C-methyl-D-erythritol 2,4-cyclodiphosphate synthase
MHVKRSMSEADRRRLLRSASASNSDSEQLSDDDKPLSAFVDSKKRKNVASALPPAKKTARKDDVALNEAFEVVIEDGPAQNEVELQLVAIETRRLDFEVAKWKQQQALGFEALRLKSEEIELKEATTKQLHQVQVMELRARLLKALDEVGKPAAQARKYLALLEG